MWACTRLLQSVHAAAELVRHGRVVVLVSYVMRTTAAVGRVILDYQYCIIVLYDSIAYKAGRPGGLAVAIECYYK